MPFFRGFLKTEKQEIKKHAGGMHLNLNQSKFMASFLIKLPSTKDTKCLTNLCKRLCLAQIVK